MCKGIPGSGKSYWAAEYKLSNPDDNVIIVTSDDIREELGCLRGGYSVTKEQKVINEVEKRIIHGLRTGKIVISADTNLRLEHEDRMRHLARICKALFVIKTFDTDIETCIERDAKRVGHRKVGADGIRRYYNTLIGNQ